MKTKIIHFSCIFVIFISACAQSHQDQQSVSDDHSFLNKNKKKQNCLAYESKKNDHVLCRPNINFLFSNFNQYDGDLISFDGFARFSSRGSLLIYLSQDMACGGIDYSAVEVFPENQLPADVINEISHGGVAKVSVSGRARSHAVSQALPAIGSLIDAYVEMNLQPDEIFLTNPKNLVRGRPKDSDFGKIRKFTCA
jgi:hypothetical protein